MLFRVGCFGKRHAPIREDCVSNRPPVSPTDDLDRAKHYMDVHGYCLVAHRLSADQLAAMTARFIEQMTAQAQMDGKSFSIDEKMLRGQLTGALNKGKIWQDMIDPDAMAHKVAAHALAPSVPAGVAKQHNLEQKFIIASMNVLFKRLELAPQGYGEAVPHMAEIYHIDQGYCPWHTPSPLSVNSFTALTDYTVGNGATIVVPGTHKQAPPNDWADYKGEGRVHLEIPAGTTIMVDGRVWHAAGLNVNGELRGSANMHYIAPWIRQTWPFALNLRQEVVDQLSDTQKKMLGFDTMFQSEYGGFAGPGIIEPVLGRENVTVKQRAIGELRLN
jgi:ectoine hydroxylase-related dioxygenase (phytanoyl-CoA dioxygenase family)